MACYHRRSIALSLQLTLKKGQLFCLVLGIVSTVRIRPHIVKDDETPTSFFERVIELRQTKTFLIEAFAKTRTISGNSRIFRTDEIVIAKNIDRKSTRLNSSHT